MKFKLRLKYADPFGTLRVTMSSRIFGTRLSLSSLITKMVHSCHQTANFINPSITSYLIVHKTLIHFIFKTFIQFYILRKTTDIFMSWFDAAEQKTF